MTYINDGVVCVAVSAPADGLSDADAALISDIVTSQTDYSLSQVRIIEVKPLILPSGFSERDCILAVLW